MNSGRAVLAIAGRVHLTSLLLAALVAPWWLPLTTFAGLDPVQSSVTAFFEAAIVLVGLWVAARCAFDAVVSP